jgi:hypothetical protein
MNPCTRIARIAAPAVLAAALAGCGGAPTGDAAAKVNGPIHVAAGAPVDSAVTVNGSITVDDGAAVTTARTVNGRISIGAHATAQSLTAVNGAVTLGAGAQVADGITVVNGPITLADGASVAGKVVNVNGAIRLDSAHVAGGITTVDGDVTVNGASRVEGGITVKRPSGSFFHVSDAVPRIVIGPGAVVDGPLDFRHAVKLYVSPQAKIGPVQGATPIPFTGPTPAG